MRKVLLIATVLLLAIGLTGCTINILPAATLQGTIQLEGGAPASNAKVTLTPASAAGTSWMGYADAAGAWTTGRTIRPEAYTIKFEHPMADSPVTITYDVLTPYKTYIVPLQTLPYTPSEGEGSKVSGTAVWDHDGNPATAMVPLMGVLITLDGPSSRTAYTDATGSFEVLGLLPGTYDIYGEKDGYAAASYMDVAVAGSEVSMPPLVLVQDKVDVGGYVYEDDGVTTIAGAAITLTPAYGAYATLHATTDALGFWSKDDIKAGWYKVKAEKTGYVTETVDLDAMDSTITTRITADVLLPAVVAPGAAGAEGMVIWDHDGDPLTDFVGLNNVKVSFIPDGGTLPIMIAYTDTTGAWSVTGLPMGLYTLTLDKTGFMTQEISLNVTAAMTYTVDTVILVPGATTEPVSVTGKVFDPADTPVVSCMVIFEPMFDWGYTRVTYTNEEGKFTIPSMIAGYYTVTLSKSTAYVNTYYDVDLTVGGESYDLGVLTIQTP